ncbi:MAG: (4Fe-4S)-binding protein [Bacillota bacterium]
MFNKKEVKDSQPRGGSQITVKEYRNQDIIVYWYPNNCSHAGKCWGELPEVFDTQKRPWVNLSGSTPEEIIRTIDKCPSRALQYSLPDGSSVDPTIARGPGSKDYKIDRAAAGKIRVIRDGPLLIQGPNQVFDPNGNLIGEADRFVLCRCGKTKNPPFCDGRHIPGRDLN